MGNREREIRDPDQRVPGFFDPVLIIFFTAVAIGLALVWPLVVTLYRGEPILLWHWGCLAAGIAVLAGCAVFIVRENRD